MYHRFVAFICKCMTDNGQRLGYRVRSRKRNCNIYILKLELAINYNAIINIEYVCNNILQHRYI